MTTRTSIKKSRSPGSVEKETKANKKKASKRDITVVDDKEVLARNSERIPKNTTKVNFWCECLEWVGSRTKCLALEFC